MSLTGSLCDRCRILRPQIHSIVIPYITSREELDGNFKKLRNVWICNKCLLELKKLIHNWARSVPAHRNMNLYNKP